MKLVSWHCQGGLYIKEKYMKLISISPEIAVIQDCPHPSKLRGVIDFHDSVWVGEDTEKGLCVLSFSDEYQLTKVVDEVKYEWIVPIKISGDADLVILPIWARRMPGYSYGKLVYEALKEYEHFLNDGQTIVIGHFNVDKNVPSSFSGIQGALGFNRLIELLDSYGLSSCYHYFSKEDFGSESISNYFHYGKREKPFHVHYCFANEEILNKTQEFYIGEREEWAELSYHLPLVLEANLSSIVESTKVIQRKTDITPVMLKEKYQLLINNEVATEDEIDEAIRYIMALRIMKRETCMG